jgi:type I restriction enzyme S subunit
MECGGNDAALAGHALDSASAEPPSPEAAERGWQHQRLGQMVDAGIVWAKNGYADGGHNECGVGIPHLRPFNVSDNGDISLSQIKSVEPPPPESPHRLRRLDVIFNNTNSEELVGKTALFDSEGAFVLSNHMTILRVLRGQELDPAWLARALHLKWLCGEFRAMCRRHVNQASISLDRLRSVELLLPPLPEQRAIAAVLRTVQGAKEACERVLAATRQLKQSLLHHFFTYGPVPFRQAAHVELRTTEFGDVPASWPASVLSGCAHVQTGVAKGRNLDGSQVVELPYLRVANVQDGRLDLTEMKTIQLRHREVGRFLLQPGDVVLTEGGDFDKLGRGFIWRGQVSPCVHQNHIFAVRPNRAKLLPEFLAYLAQGNYGKAYFLSVAHKTTNLACINTTKLKALPVLLPPLPEQREIAAELAVVDAKLAAEESRRAALAALFQSLLHHLMTGRVRLPKFAGGKI